MASKDKLKGSFGSLIDTLTSRFDPLQPDDIVRRWSALLVRCAAIARDSDRWQALSGESDAYDAVIQVLDDATHRIVVARSAAEVNDALDCAAQALGELEQVLAA